MKKLFYILVLSLLLSSCFVHKIDCYSKKYVDVTFVTKNGVPYTIKVPYCDTVKLKDNNLPDSAQATIKGF